MNNVENFINIEGLIYRIFLPDESFNEVDYKKEVLVRTKIFIDLGISEQELKTYLHKKEEDEKRRWEEAYKKAEEKIKFAQEEYKRERESESFLKRLLNKIKLWLK